MNARNTISPFAPALRPTVGALLAGALAFGFGCGEGPDALDRVDVPTPVENDDAQVACVPNDVRVTPSDGAGPIARTRPLVLAWTGTAGQVEIAVETEAGPVEGTVWEDADRAFFLPTRPFPGHTAVRWTAQLCGDTLTGAFTTGGLLRGLEIDALRDIYADKPASFDLRVGTWTSPDADASFVDIVRYRLGGAFFLQAGTVKEDAATIALVPAVANETGLYVQDLQRTAHLVDVSLADNPYVAIELDAFALQAHDKPVVIRNLALSFGFGPEGYDEGHLTGSLDLRDYVTNGGESGCAFVARSTGQVCGDCGDGQHTCVSLDIQGLEGMFDDVTLAVESEGGAR